MNPYPGPRSVLVLDNASIHHSRRFSTMMHAKGFIVLYTPPYCFNLTPLDNGAFGLLKRYLHEAVDHKHTTHSPCLCQPAR